MHTMPTIREPLSDAEMALFEIVSIPAVFGEFVRSSPHAPAEKQWRYWPQQIREMNREGTHKKRLQARNLGKSISCMDEVNSMVLLYDGVENGLALIGTRAQPNLQPLFDAMASLWQYNRFLKHFLLPDYKRAVDRKNHEIRLFQEGRIIIKGRIQGKDGQGFNTVHPNICAWIDEAQFIDKKSIAEFYGMIREDLPLLASGVPNGWRHSWAYQVDTDPTFGFTGGKMTRLEDPEATPEWIEQLARTYGGRESNLFKQKVLGEWGSASTMTFNMDLINFDISDAPLKAASYYRTVNIDAGNFRSRSDLVGLLAIGPWMPKDRIRDVYIHADHGMGGSPTTAYISFFDRDERCWRQYFRFLLHGMPMLDQVEVFDYVAKEVQMATGIRPWIGLDTTNFGGENIASVLEKNGWKMHYANFSKNIKHDRRLERQEEINKRLEKNPSDTDEAQWIDQLVPLKQVAIPTLMKFFYSDRLRPIADEDIYNQLNATTNHESGTAGQTKYETDYTKDDSAMYNHDLQAFEVLGAMLHEKDYETQAVKKTEIWMHEVDIGWGQEDPYEPYGATI